MKGDGAVIDKDAQLLFDYLRDIIYSPGSAALDVDKLSEPFRQVGEGLCFFARQITQMREFAGALAKGNLGVEPPPRDNEMAAPLKSLQASLRHVTWQSQQVAKGDYGQSVEFMGEFAEAFNTMVHQLDQRQMALLAEIESGRKKTLALEQSNSLFEAITEKIPQWIIVVDCVNNAPLYVNRTAEEALGLDDGFMRELWGWLAGQTASGLSQEREIQRELELSMCGRMRHFSITSYPLNWRNRNAVAYVLSDTSAEHKHVQELETRASVDTLTHVNNRYRGMKVLHALLAEKQPFCICFTDVDNLKNVNDSFGHSEGDLYIIDVANRLANFAPGAVACRLGGDEFMVLAPGFGAQAAEARMHEIREELMRWNGETPPYHRSLSYGVVEVGADNALAAGELLRIADERMYAFKRASKARPAP